MFKNTELVDQVQRRLYDGYGRGGGGGGGGVRCDGRVLEKTRTHGRAYTGGND